MILARARTVFGKLFLQEKVHKVWKGKTAEAEPLPIFFFAGLLYFYHYRIISLLMPKNTSQKKNLVAHANEPVTKGDLFAFKEDLELHMASKKDLASLATKKDLDLLKEDLILFQGETRKNFGIVGGKLDKIDKDIAELTVITSNSFTKTERRMDKIEGRVKVLETA